MGDFILFHADDLVHTVILSFKYEGKLQTCLNNNNYDNKDIWL